MRVARNAFRLRAEVRAGGMNAPAHAALRGAGRPAIKGERGQQIEQVILDGDAQVFGGNARAFLRQKFLDEPRGALRGQDA